MASRLVNYIKIKWHEFPEVVASQVIGFTGIGIAIWSGIRYERRDGDNRKYKESLIVMRSDDPRARFVHKIKENEY